MIKNLNSFTCVKKCWTVKAHKALEGAQPLLVRRRVKRHKERLEPADPSEPCVPERAGAEITKDT